MGNQTPTPQTMFDEAALEAGLEEVVAAGADANLAAALGEVIRSSPDVELFRINPIRFAAEKRLDEPEAIDLFLHATKAGLVQMEWNIVCVSCGNVFKSFRNLENVDPHFHCTLCDMENTSRLDDVIQVTFTVDPSVRGIIFHHPDQLALEQSLFEYRYSRNARTRVGDTTVVDFLRDATVALRYLDPGEALEVDIDLEDGSILVRDLITSVAFFVAEEGEKREVSFALTIGEDGLSHSGIPTSRVPIETPIGTILLPAVHGLGPSLVHLACRNVTSKRWPLWVVVYPSEFVSDVVGSIESSNPLSAKRLLNSSTFRRLFRWEAPGEAEGLSVADLTYLFTDLKSSTSMYDEIGDATAYNLVREHFGLIDKVVSHHDGVVVKTIGDAIMATFLTPVDAVAAAMEMIARIGEVRVGGSKDRLELKVGVHRGHSIAVTLNQRLDYFGQNVNIAARTQQLAGGSEILLTQDVVVADGVEDLLANHHLERVSAEMRGVDEEIPIYRVTG